MIPNIFISSTISDLSHLRDSIRDVIIEIGYNPIMSEYGEIGYLPSNSAEDSCYLALRDCQIAIIIIGKRYGSISKNGLSVTHNEFKTAREQKLPVIFLVSDETLSFRKIFDANLKGKDINFPGMEDPENIFQLIREFTESEINNGLVPYTNVQSAKSNLKKQLALMVGDLLQKHFDPVKGEIKDILSEITTLRHILLKNDQDVARQYSSAFRFLLNDENEYLKDIAELISGSLEKGVPELLNSQNLKAYLATKGAEFKILSREEFKKVNLGNKEVFESGVRAIYHTVLPFETSRTRASLGGTPEYNIQPVDSDHPEAIFALGKTKLWANKNAEKLLEAMFESLLIVAK